MSDLYRQSFLFLTFRTAAFVFVLFTRSASADNEEKDPLKIAGEKRFNEALFGDGYNGSTESLQTRLVQTLTKRINTIDRCCQLTVAQKQKLELAGKGAIKQLFQNVDELRQTFLTGNLKDEQATFKFIHQGPEFGALSVKVRSGPFDGDSLFSKTIRNVLTTEQFEKFDQRSRTAAVSNKVISVTNAIDLVRIAKVDKNICRIVWSDDGKQVAFVEFGKFVEVYSVPDHQVVRPFGLGKSVVSFDFSDRSNRVAIGLSSNLAMIIDESDGSEIPIDTAQPQPDVKFSPDGKMLVTGGYGKEAKLWSTATGKLIKQFDVGPGDGGLTSVFNADGTMLAVGHRNSTTRLFDVATGKLLHNLPKPMSHELNFDPTGKTLAITYVDGELVLWDVQLGKIKKSIKPPADELYSVDWSPDGNLLVTGGRNSQVTIWDAKDLSIVSELESPEWVINTRFSPDGTKLLFSGGGRMQESGRQVETWAVP